MTDPNFNPDPALWSAYEAAIARLSSAFAKDSDKEAILAASMPVIDQFSPLACRDRFGLRSGFSLAKEFFVEIFASSASAAARVLEQSGRPAQARSLLLDLYARATSAGFTRDREFYLNRIDSRTFMPMRRHIDQPYLQAAGFRHLDNVLMCVGDCQTMILAEMARQALPLPNIDIACYQHSLASLIDSPLESLFRPAAYFFFANVAADYAFLGKALSAREKFLDIPRKIVAWLTPRRPRLSVFVTHVPFGIENAVKYEGVPRQVADDAVKGFSDATAAIFAQAPNARLINFQEFFPLSLGATAFRDKPAQPMQLHFRFDIMTRIAAAVIDALKPLGT